MSNFALHPRSGFASVGTCVLWDVSDCPIPAGLGARDVIRNIGRVLAENGYGGPVKIKTYADLGKINNEFYGIPVRHLSADDDRDERLKVYMMDLFEMVLTKGGRTLNLMLIVGDISSLSWEFYRIIRLLQSRWRFKVLLAQSPDSSVPLSLTPDGLRAGLSFGEEIITRECGKRRKVPNSDWLCLLKQLLRRVVQQDTGHCCKEKEVHVKSPRDRSDDKCMATENRDTHSKKLKGFIAEKFTNGNTNEEKQTSIFKLAPGDVDAAKVAAMQAAELVNKNIVGTGYLTTDQKKKLLWGKKKSTASEESAHRWDNASALIGDRERQEKFNKLMGVKANIVNQEQNLSEVEVEKQKELQMDLEKQYTAGLRRRDGRTVGLGL